VRNVETPESAKLDVLRVCDRRSDWTYVALQSSGPAWPCCEGWELSVRVERGSTDESARLSSTTFMEER
jgi:hypothetical protein